MKPLHITCVLIAALAAVPRSSSAGPADTKSSADAEASGREHFQRGQRLSASGDYAAAYREFAAGYALTERPLFLFNMAEAARASGDVAKARENYLQFVRADPKNALAATAQARLAELDRAAAPPTTSAPPAAAPKPEPTATAAPAPSVTTPPAGTGRESPPPRLLPVPAATAPPPAAGSPTTPPPEKIATGPTGPERTPVWKTWPFWAIAGGVLAGSAIIYSVTRDEGVCGSGCTQFNFR